MPDLGRLRLRTTRDVRCITTERFGDPVQQLCLLENVEHVVRGGGIWDTGTGTDRRQVVAGYIRHGETVRGRRSDRERQASAAPPAEAATDRVHSGDVEAGGEKYLEELGDLGFGHST